MKRPRIPKAGFTIVELIMASVVLLVVVAIGYSVLRSSLVLFAQNVSMNVSATEARLSMDRLGDLIRYSKGGADLIGTNGVVTTNASAPGIVAKRIVGGPYRIRAAGGSDADIAANATSFQLQFTTDAGASSPVPLAGNWIYVVGLEDSSPDLQILTASAAQGAGDYQRVNITTGASLGEAVKGTHRLNAYLIRREAYVVVGTSANAALRHYPSVAAGMNWASAANYSVVLANLAYTGSGAFMQTVVDGKESYSIRMQVKAREYDKYLSSHHVKNTYISTPLRATFRAAAD